MKKSHLSLKKYFKLRIISFRESKFNNIDLIQKCLKVYSIKQSNLFVIFTLLKLICHYSRKK
jgi:hypothetical protein